MEAKEVITPWTNPKDLLDRKKYADFLTSYLSLKKEPFVININADWGMGKTYFLTHWKKSIESTYPTVYVDAWKSDFSDDPLIAVMSAIYDQLKEHLPEEQKTVQAFSEKLKSGGRFIRGLAPIVIKGFVHKAIGDESGNELLESFPLSAKDIEGVAEKTMGLLLEDHSVKMESIKDFKIALSDLISNITLRDRTPPLFLFIDELDRCRPTYAIELLETVKHLFSVNNIIFVIATDSDQLQHSIRAIYGDGFDGGEYLRRFFNQEYKLLSPDYDSYCKFVTDQFPYSEQLQYASFEPWQVNKENRTPNKPAEWDSKKSLATFLAFFSCNLKLSLRSINQIVIRLDAILHNSERIWDGVFLLFLLSMQANDKSAIKWMRSLSSASKVSTNVNEIKQRLATDESKAFWYQNGAFDAPPIKKYYSFSDIGLEYLSSTASIRDANKNQLHEYINRRCENISSYVRFHESSVLLEMGEFAKHESMLSYLDHVEMAGALSLS